MSSDTALVDKVIPAEMQVGEQENKIDNNIEVATNNIEIGETQQALNSVRDAVSQSINNSIEETNSNNDLDKKMI